MLRDKKSRSSASGCLSGLTRLSDSRFSLAEAAATLPFRAFVSLDYGAFPGARNLVRTVSHPGQAPDKAAEAQFDCASFITSVPTTNRLAVRRMLLIIPQTLYAKVWRIESGLERTVVLIQFRCVAVADVTESRINPSPSPGTSVNVHSSASIQRTDDDRCHGKHILPTSHFHVAHAPTGSVLWSHVAGE